MNESKAALDPKELLPAIAGFAIGLGIIAFFVLLAAVMDLTLLVNTGNLPRT